MENIIAFAVIVILVSFAVGYMIREKKNGVKCIGCPHGHKCSAHCCSCTGCSPQHASSAE